MATGTIVIADGSDLSFEGTVGFDVTSQGVKGSEYVRVSVSCYQGEDKVWGSQSATDEAIVLGSGANQWQQNGGGPASCVASLVLFGKSHGHEELTELDNVSFDATG